MSSSQAVKDALINFQQKYLNAFEAQHQSLPRVEHDSDWPSPCEQEDVPDMTEVRWLPVECQPELDFGNIESALELNLHPDIKAYYGSFYSANLAARTGEGDLELLFAWSPKDFERLLENLLGHVWMKRKLRQPVTLFFAVTDMNDINLTVNNETGEVWAEKVGKKPHRKVADSLSEFLEMLEPVV
ncbi:SecY-interacting protein [Endozoicomonas arenosclerae]|uniref:SecY-interacting protein n=1 Tax=Endozoicomonas arenosclerae TaxID=1633495 RepID=UPI000783D0F0|nr:SecY-interacting protein [Endozoicomonas arenosclerae]